MRIIIFIIAVLLYACRISADFRLGLNGGLSLAVGEGSGDMNPGLNACVEPFVGINKYFGCGGHIDYTWLTVRTVDNSISAGVHFWDIGFVPKLLLPITENIVPFFEIDPAIFITLTYAHDAYFVPISQSNTFFGMTFGTGINFKNFQTGFKFKTIFLENNTMNWVIFYIGFPVG
jgi:hypothetical protein